MSTLFACYVGGRADGCNIELHDVIFAVGEKIEDCYSHIRSSWFGSAERLHLDCYLELSQLDGYDITVGKSENNLKLFFVNCGGYKAGHFGEIHAIQFVVSTSISAAISEVKNSLEKEYFDTHSLAHFDDKFDLKKHLG